MKGIAFDIFETLSEVDKVGLAGFVLMSHKEKNVIQATSAAMATAISRVMIEQGDEPYTLLKDVPIPITNEVMISPLVEVD